MSSFLRSIISVSALKLVDYIVPIIIMPLVLTRFNLEGYGVYSYVLTISTFISFIYDACLNTVGVQQLNKLKGNEIAQQSFVISAIFFKLVFFFVCAMVFIIISETAGKSDYFCVVIFSFGFGMLNSWYYIAKDNFRFIIIVSLVVKILAVLFVLYYAFELHMFIFIQAIASALVGLISLIKIKNDNRLGKISFRHIKNYLKNIKHMYIYSGVNALIQPIINSAILASGNASLLGIYNVVMRFVTVSVTFSNSIITVLNKCNSEVFYSVGHKTNYVEVKYRSQLLKLLFYSIVVFICVAAISYISIYLTKGEISRFFIFLIFSFSLAVIPSILNQYLTQLIHMIHSSKNIVKYVICSNVLSLISIFLFSSLFPYYYIVYAVVLSPIIITICCLWDLKCKNLL
ncbi:O143 family O-antigen flippase [Escherichia coli]|uniref:O143 family O-antigen flippase n=1 Tax=Escherichia coli TaxID=562 RepID=UPI00056FAA0C|nr:O143 family O-antigen flippase [Escherichia coli]EHD3364137.1 O143 family O-antigen flippase [Escherichia coli O124]EFK6635050.1 O143 family O-antigen flippase [Escherichia coli]EFK6690637.1 O143 family O-antigen flippase [Escherichia coli]MBB2641288.1 O143 family O-antigen flippase [Escherichia coli]MDS1465193.1 O143 family O-antigen flippase [Escherichia coli]